MEEWSYFINKSGSTLSFCEHNDGQMVINRCEYIFHAINFGQKTIQSYYAAILYN